MGIGAAAAREFASRGSCVAVHYNKSEQAAKEVAASIQSAGGQATIFQADLSDHQQCCRLVAEVLQQMNRIDVLVNNAGSLVGRRSLLEIDEAFWSQVMNLNMNSVLWVSQPVITHMMERKSGAIINLGSIAGHKWRRTRSNALRCFKGCSHRYDQGNGQGTDQFGNTRQCCQPGSYPDPIPREIFQ